MLGLFWTVLVCWYLGSWYTKPVQTAEYWLTWLPWCDPPANHTTPPRHVLSDLLLCVQLYFNVDQKTIDPQFVAVACKLPSRPSRSLFMQNNVHNMWRSCRPFIGKSNTQNPFSGPCCRFFLFELKYRIPLPFSWAKAKEQYFEQTVTLEQIPPTPPIIYKIY